MATSTTTALDAPACPYCSRNRNGIFTERMCQTNGPVLGYQWNCVKCGKQFDAVVVTDIDGIGNRRASRLAAAGFETVQDVAAAQPRDLGNIPQISRGSGKRIVHKAKQLLMEEHQ